MQLVKVEKDKHTVEYSNGDCDYGNGVKVEKDKHTVEYSKGDCDYGNGGWINDEASIVFGKGLTC